MNLNNLTISENIKNIFSDFFDTVVSRNCHPEEIKKMWCSDVIDAFNLSMRSADLYKLRSMIECELSDINFSHTLEKEFKYKELVSLLFEQLSSELNLNTNKGRFVSKCIELELNLEMKHQYINIDVVEFIKSCYNKGIDVYIVSDFYMDSSFMEQLLRHHKIERFIKKVYVSSECLSSKRTGALYRKVICENDICTTETLMIGDNYHSDYVKALEEDLSSVHIDRNETFQFYEQSLIKNNIKELRCRLNEKFRDDKSISFCWMAIPLYVFIKKLTLNLEFNQIKNIIFLAREGEFLKEIYDNLSNSTTTQSHYMYASRRATYLPSLKNLAEESFSKLLEQYPRISLKSFISSLGLDKHLNSFQDALPDLSFEEQYENLESSDEFKKLISNPVFCKVYDRERARQKKYLNEYIDYLVGKEELHLVDVGWRGSIQDNIRSATGRNTTGYYCSVLSGASVSDDSIKHGLLFRQFGTNKTSIYNEFRAAFEIFCSASHGSLIKYTSFPSFGELEHNDYESNLYTSKIRPYQERLLDIILWLESSREKYALSTKEFENELINYYAKGVLLPREVEIKEISEIKHYENFGTFDYSVLGGGRNKSRLGYLMGVAKNPSFEIGKEWWKPVAFYNNGCSFLMYVYYLYKKYKLGF
ncbi:HAD hydrolase-like protein [Vibrio sp. Y2-5]|uniref:HAD hydrolase-like protein n=1 Tax=Vibrio sp. Y2-5 TaxID=2743977 RepID=UPI0016615CEA|nr:HAD hydrolase-like protein [Vibrio sp. Y2-5]MBD0787957.1 HAD hydrolase-like protein [Vibrio sp. Y2-5]